jgi:adenylate kinase family enzyme
MRGRLEQRAISSDRIDDNPDTILKRLQTFKENNAPVIEHLREHGPVYQVSKQAGFPLQILIMVQGGLQSFN